MTAAVPVENAARVKSTVTEAVGVMVGVSVVVGVWVGVGVLLAVEVMLGGDVLVAVGVGVSVAVCEGSSICVGTSGSSFGAGWQAAAHNISSIRLNFRIITGLLSA